MGHPLFFNHLDHKNTLNLGCVFFHSRCFNRCSVRRIQAWRSLACSTPASKAQNLEAAINRPWWFWGMVYYWVYHIYDSYKDIWSIYRSLMIFVHLDFTASQYISMSVELYHTRKKALNYHDHHIWPLWSGTFAAGPSLNVKNSLQPVFLTLPSFSICLKGCGYGLTWLNLGHARAPKGSQNLSFKWWFSAVRIPPYSKRAHVRFSINAIWSQPKVCERSSSGYPSYGPNKLHHRFRYLQKIQHFFVSDVCMMFPVETSWSLDMYIQIICVWYYILYIIYYILYYIYIYIYYILYIIYYIIYIYYYIYHISKNPPHDVFRCFPTEKGSPGAGHPPG